MNSTEYILACMGEEAGEVSQAVGKCLRFGLDETWDTRGVPNAQQLADEIRDLNFLAGMLLLPEPSPIKEKEERWYKYRGYSIALGTLVE